MAQDLAKRDFRTLIEVDYFERSTARLSARWSMRSAVRQWRRATS